MEALNTGATAVYPYSPALERWFKFTSRFGEEVPLCFTDPDKKLVHLPRGAEPCVCLIDEIEKVFSAKSGDSDSGTTTTMLSQLLWWLAEHKSRVLTIMTTNNAKALPPELYREGRIDEVMVFEGLTGHDAASFIEGVLATFLTKEDHLSVHANKIMAKLFPVGMFKPQQTEKRYSQAHLTKAVYEYIKTKSSCN